MQKLTELHLKPALLKRYGLPDIAYPMSAADMQPALQEDGELPLADMLYGLQQHSSDGEAQWQQIEPAMDRLAELLAPDDPSQIISAAGDHWWLEIGSVDLESKLVTIQRAGALVAAISAREDGRLRVTVFRPLDAKSAEYLIGLGQVPHPEHGVCMRENNWEYALDSSAGNGNYYAAEQGEAYLSYWEKGLGISWDGSELPDWRKQLGLVARPATRVVTELGIYSTLCSTEAPETAAEIGAALTGYAVIVTKSTVPVGTNRKVAEAVAANPPLSVRATVRTRRHMMAQQTREAYFQLAPLKLYLTEDFREAATAETVNACNFAASAGFAALRARNASITSSCNGEI